MKYLVIVLLILLCTGCGESPTKQLVRKAYGGGCYEGVIISVCKDAYHPTKEERTEVNKLFDKCDKKAKDLDL